MLRGCEMRIQILNLFFKQSIIAIVISTFFFPINIAKSFADTPISASELYASLEGRSWLWKAKGLGAGIYFGPNGTGMMSVNGEVSKIRWSTQNGKVCYIEEERSCWFVYKIGDEYFSRPAAGGQAYKWHPRRSTRKGNQVF